MPSISGRTNPTGRKKIAKADVSITADSVSGSRHLEIGFLNLQGYKFKDESNLIVVATAGNTRLRFALGTLNAWSKGPYNIDELDSSQILRFRLLVSDPATSRLAGSAENIRAVGDGDAESLIPIETADLGEELWQLKIIDDLAVIKVNISVFPTGASAQSNIAFQSFVLPAALREVLTMLASEPSKLSDDDSPWLGWEHWVSALGFEFPEDGDDKEVWVNQVIDAFCNKHQFATKFRSYEAARTELSQ